MAVPPIVLALTAAGKLIFGALKTLPKGAKVLKKIPPDLQQAMGNVALVSTPAVVSGLTSKSKKKANAAITAGLEDKPKKKNAKAKAKANAAITAGLEDKPKKKNAKAKGGLVRKTKRSKK